MFDFAVGITFAWAPKVGKVIAQNPKTTAQQAILLRTLGVQVGVRALQSIIAQGFLYQQHPAEEV